MVDLAALERKSVQICLRSVARLCAATPFLSIGLYYQTGQEDLLQARGESLLRFKSPASLLMHNDPGLQ
jgi:hypothetical protein